VLRVRVRADGSPDRLHVLRSSGYRALDQAAMKAVGQWRFDPARQAGGPIDAEVTVPVTFRLDDLS